MKIFKLVLIALFAISISGLSAAKVTGVWKTIDDKTGKAKSYVAIWEWKGKIYGKIKKLLNTAPGKENPKCEKCKGRLHNKPVVGMTMIWGLSKDGNAYEGGYILDPKNGKTYKAKIWSENPNTLKVRGYIGFFFRTQTWYRVK